jgi:hypothetical protein
MLNISSKAKNENLKYKLPTQRHHTTHFLRFGKAKHEDEKNCSLGEGNLNVLMSV